MQDPLSDFITRIRNASRAGKSECAAQHSKLKKSIADILEKEGFIQGVDEGMDKNGHRRIIVRLKYVAGAPAINGIKNVSRPGCRVYYRAAEIPRTLGGLGIAILTTSKGVMHDRDARRRKVGGELICRVW